MLGLRFSGQKTFVSDGSIDGPWRWFRWLPAPYEPGEINDYAVIAEIKAVNIGELGNGPCGPPKFGVVVRAAKENGYGIGVAVPLQESCGGVPGSAIIGAFQPAEVIMGHALELKALQQVAFDPGYDWHTYRVEVQGTRIQLFVDEDTAPLVQAANTRFLKGGKVGLWFDGVQVSVKSFSVIMR